MPADLTSVQQIKNTLIDLALNFGPKILAGLLVMIAGMLVSRWVGSWLQRGLQHIEMEPPVRQLLVRIVRALLLAVFAIMALQNLGVQLLPLLAGLGVAGAGVALATQGVLSNVVAGLTIIFAKPFRVGEYISIAGEEGVVVNISLFSTTLSHLDLSRVVIPNRKIVGEILHNYGGIRQLNITVGVARDSDMTQVLNAIDTVLARSARVLREPAPVVRTLLLDDFAVRIGVMPWVAAPDYGDAIGELNRALLESFRAGGITLPLPQREVRLLDRKTAP
jgi:small conductance mechanosensitive channel